MAEKITIFVFVEGVTSSDVVRDTDFSFSFEFLQALSEHCLKIGHENCLPHP
jgi:hypothetical protein